MRAARCATGWSWGDGERADVYLGPVMITLFTRAIYEDAVELPAGGLPAPCALHRRPRRRARRSHRDLGPGGGGGCVRPPPDRVRGGARRDPPRVHGAARAGGTGHGGGVSFTPYDRPVRAAIVGLGRIYDLNVRAYVGNDDVEVVALVDPDEDRRRERQADLARSRDLRVGGRAGRERPRGRRGRGAAADPAARDRRRRAPRPRLAREPAEADGQRRRRARSG